MANSDYYKVLGVSREASTDEIRKAYKKLARENHPDVKPDDKSAAEKFKQVQEAYAVLGDPEQREQFDRYGAAFQGGGRGPGGRTYNWSSGPGGAGQVDLRDLFGGGINFGDLFGGGGGAGGGFRGAGPRAASPVKGEDTRIEIVVPFQVAADGGHHELQLRRGETVERLDVTIPAGVDTGSVIRLAGQGAAGHNRGPAGDLMLNVRVAPHPFFRREGSHLILDLPVTPAEAVLGAKVEIPTLPDGSVVVTIPPGTSSGTRLRLREKGVREQKTGRRGDQLVVVKIVVPKQLGERTTKLYEELRESETDDPRSGLW